MDKITWYLKTVSSATNKLYVLNLSLLDKQFLDNSRMMEKNVAKSPWQWYDKQADNSSDNIDRLGPVPRSQDTTGHCPDNYHKSCTAPQSQTLLDLFHHHHQSDAPERRREWRNDGRPFSVIVNIPRNNRDKKKNDVGSVSNSRRIDSLFYKYLMLNMKDLLMSTRNAKCVCLTWSFPKI